MEGSRTLHPFRRERVHLLCRSGIHQRGRYHSEWLYHHKSLRHFSDQRPPRPSPPHAASAGGNHRHHGRKQPCSACHLRSASPRVQAQYVPKQRTIFVRNGMDETATICAIAREQAHASFDMVGSGYYRQAYAAQAYCAAYVAAQNSAWIPPPFISTRCAKAMRKGARTISAAFGRRQTGRLCHQPGRPKELPGFGADHPAG